MRFVFREFLILIESIVFIPGLLAQPDWVKSLRQNVEAFIPSQEADVVVLHNRMQIEFKDFRRARSRLEKAYKILHSVTASEYARLYEPCSSERRVEHIKGWLLRPDGSSESLKDEYILQIHPEVSAKYYDDNLVTLASYPTVRPGDIVAYEYDINEEEWESMYHTFTFHVQQPVLFSQLEVIIPDKWDLHTSGWHMDSIRYEKPNSNTYRWTGRMLPYLPEEPLMPSWSFIAQSIEFVAVPSEKQADNDFSSWRSVAVWASRVLATKETTDDTTLHQTAVRLTENCKTEEEKVRAITEYVRDAIRYVGVEIGKGRFQPRLPSITLYNKFGDCKDKAVLTCALLHEVGFEAIPALANLSKYVESELPSPFQFNHCIVAISAKLLSNSHLDGVQSGGWYFFDPTDEKTTLGTLPTALLGSRVLLPLDEDSVLVQLPTLKPENRMRIYSADLTINKKGEYSGKVSIVDYGQW
jgi:transglutaminase-like putative cysteine protease